MPIMYIGAIAVDAYINESHSLEAEVTKFEVEQGGDVTDNVRAMPFKFSVQGEVSDAPLGSELAAARDAESAGDKAPSEFVYAQLEKLNQTREPVTVSSSLRAYTSMVMTSCVINRDKETSKVLSFSASFEQIRIVTNKRVAVRVAQTLQKKGFKAGGKQAIVQSYKDADGATQERVVYDRGGGKFVYGDGSPYVQKKGQTTADANAQQIKLDKAKYGHPRPDQKAARAQGQPFTPSWSP